MAGEAEPNGASEVAHHPLWLALLGASQTFHADIGRTCQAGLVPTICVRSRQPAIAHSGCV